MENKEINFTELAEKWKRSWLFAACKKTLNKWLKHWWLLILVFLLGFGIHYWTYSNNKISYQTTLILQANFVKKRELQKLLVSACQADAQQFQNKIGLTDQDYKNLGLIKKVGILYRYDWLQLTPLAKTKKSKELAWLGMQEVTLLSLELKSAKTDSLLLSLIRLFEDSKKLKQIKDNRKAIIDQALKNYNIKIRKLADNYENELRPEEFYKEYYKLRKDLYLVKIEYSNMKNLSYITMTDPVVLGKYKIWESLLWAVLLMLFTGVLIGIKP